MLGYKLNLKDCFPTTLLFTGPQEGIAVLLGKGTLFLVMAPTTNSCVTLGAFGGDKLLIQSALSWF